MSSLPSSLTLALSSIEAEIFSATPFSAVGYIQPQGDGRVRFEVHTPVATGAAFIHDDQLQPAGATSRLREFWRLGPVTCTPLGSHGTELFGAIPGGSLSGDELKTLSELARRIETISAEGEPFAIREERWTRLEALADVLRALSSALDIRDVFERLSDTARQVLPHDFAAVFTVHEDARHTSMYALSKPEGWTLPKEGDSQYPRAVVTGWEFAVYRDLFSHAIERDGPAARLGLHSSIRMPIRVDRALTRTLDFSAFRPHQYSAADLPIVRRIADYVELAFSHQQLADDARDAVALRARAANAELLDELLARLADSGELSDIFDAISGIAKRVLPHDILALSVLPPGGASARLYARSGGGAGPPPEVFDVPASVGDDAWEYDLSDDIQVQPGPRDTSVAQAGCRALMRVPIRIDGTFAAALSFLSFTPATYAQADVQIARRIADRIALLLARERGLEASRRADEASARAARLEARVRALTEELDARTGYRRVLGESQPWRQVLTHAAQVAATEATVLLLGESGTGKEVVARFIHRGSTRRDGPFVALNCAALPENLLEAELFGFERGAFTGATQSKPGQIESAAGGVLFLDEVGEMTPSAQAKFLRVLQEREFQRLGGNRVLRADVRVLAATNRDLPKAIERGTFREDLYYRLNVFPIRLPALRERRDDILTLSDAFMKEIGRSLGRPPAGFARDARQSLLDYHWPGNVRELRNIIERAAILSDGGLIASDHLGLAPVVRATAAPAEAKAVASPVVTPPGRPATAGDLQSMERAMIEQALQDAHFNKKKTATILGLTRAQLYVRLKRYGLE